MPMMGPPRGRPSLLNQLVAPNRPLPQPRAQGALVGTPKPLPGLIQTGPQPQGLVQSSRFTGGNVPGGALSLTHPEQQPTFEAPQYQTPQAPQTPQSPRLAPILAALAAGGFMGAPTGATAATPSPFTPPPPTAAPPPLTAFPGPGSPAPPGGAPLGGLGQGGRLGVSPALAQGTANIYNQPPPLGALLAGLAQRGQRLGNVPRL